MYYAAKESVALIEEMHDDAIYHNPQALAAEDERVDSHLLSAMYSSVMTDERPEQETSCGLNPPPPAGEPIRRPLPAAEYPAQAYGAEQVSGLERRGSEEPDSKRQRTEQIMAHVGKMALGIPQ